MQDSIFFLDSLGVAHRGVGMIAIVVSLESSIRGADKIALVWAAQMLGALIGGGYGCHIKQAH